MAKKGKATVVTGALAGKKIAFVGKFGYRDSHRNVYTQLAESAGGIIVDPDTATPDCVVLGEGRGGKPPGAIAKIQKKSPAVDILDTAAFLQQVLPSPEALIAEIRKGRRHDRDRYWENLNWHCREANSQIDLNKSDLRKVDLYGAHLEWIALNGSDLRGAKIQYTEFGDLEAVNFSECDGQHVYLKNLTDCTFHRADLRNAWFFHGYGRSDKMVGCDFTDANMSGAQAEGGTLTECKFTGADLSDVEFNKSIFQKADFTRANLTSLHAAQAKFTDCKFSKANLNRADLRGTSLVRADLRGANLREAVLSNADLTDADVTGADFQDAVLTGATLNGVDFAKAKNFTPPVLRTAGPKLQELIQAFAGAKSFYLAAEVDLGKDEFARLQLNGPSGLSARSVYRREGKEIFDRIAATTIQEGVFGLVDRWPNATLRLDSIEAKGSKTLRGKKLLDLATAAWAEAFGVTLSSPEELKAVREEQEASAAEERDELMKKIRKEGAKVWDEIDYRIRDRYDLRGVDLSGAPLDNISLWGKDMKGANFSGSSMKGAELFSSQLQGALFEGTDLENGRLQGAVLTGANFQQANLTNANLEGAKLQGADFAKATLTGSNLDRSQFDQTTIFPTKFRPPENMIWKGEGLRPGMKQVKAAQAGTLEFDTFLQNLNNKVELSRMQKAGAMLKAERFELFADVQTESLVGIVKSQSDKDLVYSCRLAADGAFGCCTQNLRPCGGLRGALCKHLLVLIIGLAKAGKLDSATVDHWINLSRSQKPALHEESMSATFLRYKGAEAGEVDWRPTETIPEDFYAM